MNKPYGFRGELKGYPWHDLAEEFENDGISFKIAVGLMEVGYDKQVDEQKARDMAQNYIRIHNFSNPHKIIVDFNHSWKPNATGGRDLSLSLSDSFSVEDRVQIQTQTHQVNIQGRAYIVSQQAHDSASFTNDTTLVNKALKDPTLAEALEYFSEEVVDDNRPLYGVYKALEVIADHLGSNNGWAKLAILANQTDNFVRDITTTTQTTRHTGLKQKLISPEECIERAKVLIKAYADSIT